MILPDGHLATKDFGGVLPGRSAPAAEPAELLVLEPERLEIVARLPLPERSIARLSADGDDIYVVGDESLLRARWDGTALTLDDGFRSRYRTLDGQGYGWDAVLDGGAAWFLDDGEGSRAVRRHLSRSRRRTGAVAPRPRRHSPPARSALTDVCGLPGGIVANPPVVDPQRRIAVGYDSGNGVLAAFTVAADGTLEPRWQRPQYHASPPDPVPRHRRAGHRRLRP